MKKARVAVLVLTLFVAASALAEVGVGPRLGYTHDSNFDQFHFGAQLVSNISRNVHLIPSAELGVGDGTLFAFNADLVYEFTELATGTWSFYAGGGPTITHFNRDSYDSTDVALSLIAGVTYDWRETRQFFGEFRFGIEDAPAFKFTVGLNFF